MPRSNQMNRNPKERPTESTEVKWIFLHSGKCEGIILHLYLLKSSLKGQHGRIAHNEDLKIKPLPGELESQAAGPLSKALCPHQPSDQQQWQTAYRMSGSWWRPKLPCETPHLSIPWLSISSPRPFPSFPRLLIVSPLVSTCPAACFCAGSPTRSDKGLDFWPTDQKEICSQW